MAQTAVAGKGKIAVLRADKEETAVLSGYHDWCQQQPSLVATPLAM